MSSVDLNESDVGHKRVVNHLTSNSDEEQDEVLFEHYASDWLIKNIKNWLLLDKQLFEHFSETD